MPLDKPQDKFQEAKTVLSASGRDAYPETGLRQMSAAPSQTVDCTDHVRHLDSRL